MAATFPLAGAAMHATPALAKRTTDAFSELGRFLFALGLAMLGVQIPLVADFVRGLEPVPTWLPLQLPLAYLSAAVLLGASLMIASGWHLRTGALAAALLFLAWLALLQLPRIIAHPSDGNGWTTTFEVLALFAAAWLVAGTQSNAARSGPVDTAAAWVAPRLFGACLLVFGSQHFVYNEYVASVIPAWIPAHVFFACFTGVAHIAAGIAIITGMRARLAATLLGGMFLSWVILLHIPRVAATPDSRAEWTNLLIATALTGAAWLVASRFARPMSAPAPARIDAAVHDALNQDILIEAALISNANEAA